MVELSSDLITRIDGKAGRITLNRPKALNALSYEMVLGIEKILNNWRGDEAVELVIIDAVGEKAFCAGGDIQEMYRTATEGNFNYGRRFWADEYRMNALIAEYPKPFIAFIQGFDMGGGVGVSCHCSHRIVGDSTRIAMPECGIGLIPDIGGSLLLGRAPGHCGEYIGTTGYRMGPGDAIFAGFADHYLPEAAWPELISTLCETGDSEAINQVAQPSPNAPLCGMQERIDAHFGSESMNIIWAELPNGDFGDDARAALSRQSPLSLACAVPIIRASRAADDIRKALSYEYGFTARSASHGDFIEGIRAAVIDKDRNPNWKHQSIADVSEAEIKTMLQPFTEIPLEF